MRRKPISLEVVFTAGALTRFGGMLLVQLFLHRVRLRPASCRSTRFAQPNQRYSIRVNAPSVTAMVVLRFSVVDFANNS